jgi:hypothetical protein
LESAECNTCPPYRVRRPLSPASGGGGATVASVHGGIDAPDDLLRRKRGIEPTLQLAVEADRVATGCLGDIERPVGGRVEFSEGAVLPALGGTDRRSGRTRSGG